MKKKKNIVRKIITWAIVLCLVAGLALLPSFVSQEETGSDIITEIKSAQVETRTIDSEIIGGGQLKGESADSVTIPVNIKLESYLVGNGDTVSKGDPIAQVDSVSVMKAIADVQEVLTELSSQIEDAADTADTGTLKAAAGGRVKAIYAEAGDSVSTVMLEYGCLAILSLDDTMAVSIPNTDLDIGTSVTVQFSDGTQADGVVKNVSTDDSKVVFDDDSYEIGTEVSVLDADGKDLGSGSVYVNNAWKVTADSGTVSSVSVKVGAKLSTDQTIFKLKDLGSSSEYQKLIDQRQQYEELMQTLFQMYRSGVIEAPCDGIVSDVDTKGTYMLSAYAEAEGAQEFELVFLATEPTEAVLQFTTDALANGKVGTLYGSAIQVTDGTNAVTGEWAAANLPDGLTIDTATGLISGTPTTAGTFTVTIGFRCGEDILTKDYTISIEEAENQVQYVGYIAKVTDAAADVIKVSRTENSYAISDLNALPTVTPDDAALTVEGTYNGPLIADGQFAIDDYLWIVVDGEGNLTKAAKIQTASDTPDTPSDDPDQPGGDTPGTDQPGGDTPGTDQPGGDLPSEDVPSAGDFSGVIGGGSIDLPGGVFSGSMPSGGSSVDMPAMDNAEDTLYSLDTTAIATVTSQEHMSVTVDIDELDITRIYVGQTATITMNALPGETSEAVVKSIANSGENSGGNSKFSVEFELEKTDSNMLPGMSATVFVQTASSGNVLCVPASALYDINGKTYVYTGYDEKNEALIDPIEVTIGAADTDYVEVTGLNEGDRVYYETYAGSVAINAAAPNSL